VKKLAVILAIFLVLVGLTLALRGRLSRSAGELTERVGVCGRTPNCVSSHETREEFRVEPLSISGTPEEAFERAREVAEALPRARVVVSEAGYLHLEVSTALLGFVDDLELELDAESGVVHVRSASRVGNWDLGVNRKRVERIREALSRG
jgi:uncharacterized protein (DUF1499 family)